MKRYATFRPVTFKPWPLIEFKPLFVGCMDSCLDMSVISCRWGQLVSLAPVHCGRWALSVYLEGVLDFSALSQLFVCLFGQTFNIFDGN